MFNPKSIAVIGASRNPQKLGNIVIKNILDSGYKGKVYPINPKADKIKKLKCYPSILDLRDVPDLAIISLPSQFVMPALVDIDKKGTKNVVIFTAGFKETGEKGKNLEKELEDFAKIHEINILGPNCLGFANTTTPLNATFGKASNKKGNLRFLSQSGAVAAAIFDWAENTALGFGEFVTLGNKTVINENDVLRHWLGEELEDFAPIGMYLESISNGALLMDLAKKLSEKHPIFALKPGKSTAAKKAMQSHTGAIAGEDHILDAAFKQCGIIRCHDIQDMFDLSMAFSWSPIPKGPNVAVVSNAGGPAVISADLISEHSLQLAKLSDETQKILEKNLPREASLLNPVDILGDALADRYAVALEAVLKDEGADSVLIILTPQIMTQIESTSKVISKLAKKYQKPMICAFIGGSQVAVGDEILDKNQVPAYGFPERAIKVLEKMYVWSIWSENQKKANGSVSSLLDYSIGLKRDAEDLLNKIVERANKEKRKALTLVESNEVLKIGDLLVPEAEVASSIDAAKEFVKDNHYPVVLKVSSKEFIHKKEFGGVITNINSAKTLENRFHNMSEKFKGDDLVVQKQVDAGVEVIVGIKKDPSFGYVLMVGAGGTFAELVLDRNLLVLPVAPDEIDKLIKNSKVYELLKGYRGGEAYDIDGLINFVYKLSQFVLASDIFSEIEINPVIVTRENTWGVDGKAILK